MRVTGDANEVKSCDSLCVPGQGIFGRCIDNITSTRASELIREWIDQERPFLGICLGMQILFDRSEEGGGVDGLGILEGNVARLPSRVKVPHIGWNEVAGSEVDGGDDSYFYFDHSYAVFPGDEAIVSGWCEHGDRFAAAIRTGSILGVQFHPEKSGSRGIDLLRGWLT